jgi:hypothetical protein
MDSPYLLGRNFVDWRWEDLQSWATPSLTPRNLLAALVPFWHSLPTRPAPQDASSREGPALPLLAVAWHLYGCVCVCWGVLDSIRGCGSQSSN